MSEIADEQNEQNARDMQQPDQQHALAGRVRKPPFGLHDAAEQRPAENTERRE